jgi:septation ring formation regulator EzrA
MTKKEIEGIIADVREIVDDYAAAHRLEFRLITSRLNDLERRIDVLDVDYHSMAYRLKNIEKDHAPSKEDS